MPAPKRWSFTSWSLSNCPKLYHAVYHQGNRGPQGPSAARGERIHKLSEYYLKGEITGGVPGALRKLQAEFKGLKAVKPVVEEFWGVTPEWKFKANDSWCVMKMDAAVVPTKKNPCLDIIDIKTGREYDKHEEQGELYVAIGFAKYPFLEEAYAEFWYTDAGYVTQRHYTRAEIVELRDKWMLAGQEVMSMNKFPAKPSEDACRWCHLRSDKGGSCKEWTKVSG